MKKIKAIIKSALDSRGVYTADEAPHPQPIGFSCPVCGEVYARAADAVECRDQPVAAGPDVGDIVVVPSAWHNHCLEEGSPWLAFTIPPDPRAHDHFDRAGYLIPYFVVTAVHRDRRDPHRGVVTLAQIASGTDSGMRAGWNPADGEGHYAMFRVSDGARFDGRSTWFEGIKEQLEACKPSKQLRKEAAQLAASGIRSEYLI